MADEKELLAAQEKETWANERRNRLPTFREVLARQTKPPVDLFMFYLFLQREGAEDVLDFWLDVQQHENLCRAYFKDLKKAGKSVKDEWPHYYDFARRRGSIYGTVVGIPGAGKRSTMSSAEVSEEERQARNEAQTSQQGHAAGGRATVSPRASGVPGSPFDWKGPTPVNPDPFQRGYTSPSGSHAQHGSVTPFSGGGRFGRYSSMAKRLSRAPTILPRDGPVSHAALIASAERIYGRYLVPGAEKEIYLPPSLRIHSFMLSSDNPPPMATGPGLGQGKEEYEMEQAALAQVPDMFHSQKEYVFSAMEQDAFPRFLRAKAFGNLTPVSALVRLVLGLLSLWIGLSTGFALIFLDVKPKSKRFFLFIPFTLAILFLVSHQYELDPILLLVFNQSETTPFRTLAVREPYVKKLLVGRAIWVSVLVAVLTTILTIIFWAVPGHRL
ncbi:Bud site selection protein, Revert to axial protein 1 [Serendipita sp. 396]|nr:Bud site selection protein, Revert to axial protein 1 [Serendipita sp. 396]KAG8789342.1 Bud site selection protein, Revert to axial protein 1 [Serendipita sp. 397]KAG8804576.1 Bud site selection protein, Revert to axial protein 1 [Serendipita sp. 398]KAG8878698.1 Bud site selection protein, Revert to axial protein 1 [Serendipita sp. 405]